MVPPVQQTLEWMCEKYFGGDPAHRGAGRQHADRRSNVDHPREVGADRVVKCGGRASRSTAPPLIVDRLRHRHHASTASTRAGEFIGGAIAPGISTAADALVNRAARLFRVELVRPKDAIGRNTVTNIQSGVIYG